MDGIINVYKEKGFTSHDVVAKLRGILRMKKIGHTGTLDPAAEGVLPVCLGKGTRLCDMLTDKTKTYRAVLLLGKETDTQDTTGAVQAEYPVHVTEEEVREAILSFLGDYMQIPPMYSALKVNGKKLYELARQGKEVEREARPVQILDIQIESIELPRVTFSVSCSKGTYIRTLCYDIGRRLGCGGCMESLLRTRVDCFVLEDSLTLSQIEKLRDAGRVEEHVVPVEGVFLPLSQKRETGTSWYITEIRSRRSLQSRKRLQKEQIRLQNRQAGQKPNVIWLYLWQIVLMVSVSTTVNISLSVFTVTTKKNGVISRRKYFLGETSYEGDYRDQRVLHRRTNCGNHWEI